MAMMHTLAGGGVDPPSGDAAADFVLGDVARPAPRHPNAAGWMRTGEGCQTLTPRARVPWTSARGALRDGTGPGHHGRPRSADSGNRGEQDFEAPLAGLLDEPSEVIDEPQALVATAEPGDVPGVRVAIVLPRNADHVISAATSMDDVDPAVLGRAVFEQAYEKGCMPSEPVTGLPGQELVFQRDTADAPAGYLGAALLSMDQTSVLWKAGEPAGSSIGLGSTAITAADTDLRAAMEFFAPSDSKTEWGTFRGGDALFGRSERLEFVMWVEDGALRSVQRTADVAMPIAELADTIGPVDDDTWNGMIADLEFKPTD